MRIATQCHIAMMLRDYLGKLHRKLPLVTRRRRGMDSEGVVHKHTKADGSRAVTGGPKLKATQVYTCEFGRAVSVLHKRHTLTIKDFLKAPSRRMLAATLPAVDMSALDIWPDADLQPVHRFLRRRQHRG
jgi:hypothetical protein